jgi:GT2 family glycosyltransferase
MAHVSEPYVAFCDDDTWWERGSLPRAAALLDAHPEVAVLTGRILVEPGGREDPINAELRDSPIRGAPGLPGPALGSFLAGASVVRRRAFEAVGGFDARIFLGGEEEMLASRLLEAGWALCHVPDLVVHHEPSPARDPHLRRRRGVRNVLWFWWLRRPAGSALRRTVALLCTSPHDRVTFLGVYDALRGLPYVVRNRRVVPPYVEDAYRRLDEPQRTSKARRYIS